MQPFKFTDKQSTVVIQILCSNLGQIDMPFYKFADKQSTVVMQKRCFNLGRIYMRPLLERSQQKHIMWYLM